MGAFPIATHGKTVLGIRKRGAEHTGRRCLGGWEVSSRSTSSRDLCFSEASGTATSSEHPRGVSFNANVAVGGRESSLAVQGVRSIIAEESDSRAWPPSRVTSKVKQPSMGSQDQPLAFIPPCHGIQKDGSAGVVVHPFGIHGRGPGDPRNPCWERIPTANQCSPANAEARKEGVESRQAPSIVFRSSARRRRAFDQPSHLNRRTERAHVRVDIQGSNAAKAPPIASIVKRFVRNQGRPKLSEQGPFNSCHGAKVGKNPIGVNNSGSGAQSVLISVHFAAWTRFNPNAHSRPSCACSVFCRSVNKTTVGWSWTRRFRVKRTKAHRCLA